MERSRITRVIVLAALCAGCASDSPGPPQGATVTFAVVGETFRVSLTTDEQLEAARATQAGRTARIPVGRIVSGTQVNSGWSWHLEDVAFAETAIELCDGRPSDVERLGTVLAAGATARGARASSPSRLGDAPERREVWVPRRCA
jgi:hypothetical protein